MKVEYIFHSGFTVETDNYFLVFDYYKGDIELKDKKTLVFCSHAHHDHFNPEIFNWMDKNKNLLYVMSSDIDTKPSIHTYILDPYEDLKLHDIEINTFGSTDQGVSYLIKVEGKTIFFAGDLNWWYWNDDSDKEKFEMEKAFKDEIEKIKGHNIDLSFFPVDPRLEENYYLGGEYFINEIRPKVFIPMHFGDNFDVTREFIHKMKGISTIIVEITTKNQMFNI
ncbi:MBL fold metallo-hydrolase [Tissierella sp. Yu-01]|uniref:MBL fold metallo-hydrolase n=1 Tax=Tissierella sp. Yu-01 TaxID=3035694 RepID=UPI00240DD850|nr:MBL fold metallo-hydrolase [Tissierella sp. Yu-01]WFA08251.1 MBL fold metallo-hydrolase [Tissierella sp. Yu-01]